MTEKKTDYITEANEMLGKGYRPVVQFEPPSEQIVETVDGNYEIAQSLGWVKLSAFFRQKMLAELKGAKLSVFLCICLHVNENGVAFPGIETIAKETDLHRNTVMETIAELENIPGLLQVIRERGKSNRYRPSYAARGAKNEPSIPVKETLTSPKKEQASTQVVNETLTTPVKETLTLSRKRKKNNQKKGDLVDGYLDLSRMPGVKKQVRLEGIQSRIAVALNINCAWSRWERFIRYADKQEQEHGQTVEAFMDWLKRKPGFDVTYWPPDKMQEVWPQAFIPSAEDHNRPHAL